MQLNTTKLNDYFNKPKFLVIDNYWVHGKGWLDTQMEPVNIQTEKGKTRFLSFLKQIKINGATKIAITTKNKYITHTADFCPNELLIIE